MGLCTTSLASPSRYPADQKQQDGQQRQQDGQQQLQLMHLQDAEEPKLPTSATGISVPYSSTTVCTAAYTILSGTSDARHAVAFWRCKVSNFPSFTMKRLIHGTTRIIRICTSDISRSVSCRPASQIFLHGILTRRRQLKQACTRLFTQLSIKLRPAPGISTSHPPRHQHLVASHRTPALT